MRYLLNLLETELSQPATQLYPHNLAGILETAIRCICRFHRGLFTLGCH